jgi:nucleotide-binding universal stress UspA family protein
MFKKILVASDGSSVSMSAAQAGAAIARALGAELTVVTAAYFPKAYEQDVGPDMQEGYLDEWKRVLTETAKTVKEAGTEPRTKLLRTADVVEALVGEIEEGGYDLAIIGRTGRGRPSSDAFGSVSREIAQRLSCSLLVVT